jgi:hypothetical protein
MALTHRKSDTDKFIKALKSKKQVGFLSEERKTIRVLLDGLKKDEMIEIDLPEGQYKTYNNNNKKSTTHPLLDKIKLEAKYYNTTNRDITKLYIIVFKDADIAYVAKHSYADIKDAIVMTTNNKERIKREAYYEVLKTLQK